MNPCIPVYPCMHTSVYACTCEYVHIHIHAQIYTCTRIQTPISTHIFMRQ